MLQTSWQFIPEYYTSARNKCILLCNMPKYHFLISTFKFPNWPKLCFKIVLLFQCRIKTRFTHCLCLCLLIFLISSRRALFSWHWTIQDSYLTSMPTFCISFFLTFFFRWNTLPLILPSAWAILYTSYYIMFLWYRLIFPGNWNT